MNDEINQPSLQEIQAELARSRTVLALDRTLLAWVRTSLSLNAFGFTLARFVHDVILSGSLHGVDAKIPRQLGITLMILGIAGLLAGASDYWRSVKRLRSTVAVSDWSASLVLALILAVISLMLIASLFTDLNSV